MGSVCECCLAAYCSCLATAARLDKLEFLLGQQQQEHLQVDFYKKWEVWNRIENWDCAVHGHCSFCSRPLSQLGKNERSVKRKFARVYAEEGIFSSRDELVREGNDSKKVCDHSEQVRCLMEALEAEREAVSALSVELEEERNAAAIAATETLAMITRLQEEKAAVQMEASQYKRMVEERTEYDQEAIGMLNEILARQEEEKLALSREVEMFRSSFKKRSPSSTDSGASTAGTSFDGGERGGRNLMESFEKVDTKKSPQKGFFSPGVYRPARGTGVALDEECSGTSGAPCRTTRSSDSFESEFMEKYGSKWRGDDYGANTSSVPSKNSSRSYDSVSSSSGLYSSVVDEGDNVDRIIRALGRPNGKLNGELRELSRRLQALEAERDFAKRHMFGDPRSDGGDMEILAEISQQLRQIQAMDRKSDDVKEMSEASFVFSFKGFFSFNGLRQSLNSNLNRLACMFLKHTDASGLNYGDHHVGLSHLLESSSRKSPRPLPCITRGIKVDTPPLLPSSSYAVLHRQNVDWPMDARGRAETAFSGWDY